MSFVSSNDSWISVIFPQHHQIGLLFVSFIYLFMHLKNCIVKVAGIQTHDLRQLTNVPMVGLHFDFLSECFQKQQQKLSIVQVFPLSFFLFVCACNISYCCVVINPFYCVIQWLNTLISWCSLWCGLMGFRWHCRISWEYTQNIFKNWFRKYTPVSCAVNSN